MTNTIQAKLRNGLSLHGSHRLSGLELTGAPKARIVSFPTRLQATVRSFSFGWLP
jgi:hypothetical protein